MKQTIVAIYNVSTDKDQVKANKVSNNQQWLEICKQYGEIISLDEFAYKYNADEINFNKTCIRFIEAELEVKSCN